MVAPLKPQEAASPPLAAMGASAPAGPQNTSQGYVRPPGREIAGLTRAHRDEPEAPTQASAQTQASAPTSVPAPPTPPDVPGITRARHEEGEIPAVRPKLEPLFSNEGMVRLAEAQEKSRVLGPAAGVIGALVVSGTALGRGLGSHLPGTKNAAPSRSLPPVDDPRARGGRRRRAAGALILAGLLGVITIGFGSAAVLSLMPNSTGLASGPGDSSSIAVGVASMQPYGSSTPAPSAAPTSIVMGEGPLAPDPVGQMAAPAATGTPKLPTPKPPVSTPKPPTPKPPTTPPTPAPAANSVAFEPAGSTNGSHTATYSVPRGTNFTFIIDGLGGARCSLSSIPHMGGAPRNQLVPGNVSQVNSIILTTWGSNWPVGTYTVTATCTLAGQPTATASQTVHVN